MRFSSSLVGQHLTSVADLEVPTSDPTMPVVVESKQTPDHSTSSQVVTFTGLTVGETLIAVFGSDYYTLANMPDVTSTAGTPALAGFSDVGDNLGHMKIFTIPVANSGTQTVTVPAHIDCDVHGIVFRVSSAVTVDDFAAAMDTSNLLSAHTAPAVETTGPNRLLVCGWLKTNAGSSWSGEQYSVPGSMTKRGETSASPFSGMAVATEEIPDAGDTGTRVATWFEPKVFGAFSMALAPSEGAPGVALPHSALYMTPACPVVKTSDALTLPVMTYQTGRVTSDVANTTTTLADMTGLSFPVVAGGVYLFDFSGSYTVSSTSSWITTALAGPTGATSVMVNHHFHVATGLDTFHSGCSSAFGGTNTPGAFLSASAICAWRMYGSFEIGATAGSVVPQFSRTSGAATATIKKNSYGWVRRIA